ncbi:hypothetical protein ABEB36_010623 [Hypothenemus hampei]|uniref:MADF domain-containing protein n=1 Tax=Hypothenemus hampei TaxID=57062 RepID=A0ABD1ECU7_HYPHA
MADLTEKLIEYVKQHNVLYDMSHADYKNVRIKNKVWDAIAKEIGNHSGDDLKKRWKNLRDCFSKHLRSEKTRTGQAAKSTGHYKAWPWAYHMEFFRLFLKFAQTESNISITDNIAKSPKVVDKEIEACNMQNESSENVSEASSGNLEKERSTKISSHQKRKAIANPASNNSSNVDKVIDFLTKRHSDVSNNSDSVDLTFQGYAASVKKLSNRRQTLVKYKIAKILMEEELAQEAETQTESRSSRSFSNSPGIVHIEYYTSITI